MEPLFFNFVIWISREQAPCLQKTRAERGGEPIRLPCAILINCAQLGNNHSPEFISSNVQGTSVAWPRWLRNTGATTCVDGTWSGLGKPRSTVPAAATLLLRKRLARLMPPTVAMLTGQQPWWTGQCSTLPQPCGPAIASVRAQAMLRTFELCRRSSLAGLSGAQTKSSQLRSFAGICVAHVAQPCLGRVTQKKKNTAGVTFPTTPPNNSWATKRNASRSPT